MSDVPPSPADGPDTPPMDELDRLAYDAVVRNAPRFGRIIGTGIAVGAAAGFGLGFLLPNGTGVGRFTVGLVIAMGFAIIGGLVTAVIATGVDGTRSVPDARPFPWDAPRADAVGQPHAAAGSTWSPDAAAPEASPAAQSTSADSTTAEPTSPAPSTPKEAGA